jgi:hypothetical protein
MNDETINILNNLKSISQQTEALPTKKDIIKKLKSLNKITKDNIK